MGLLTTAETRIGLGGPSKNYTRPGVVPVDVLPDALPDAGSGLKRPWWEDIYQDDEPLETEPLVEAVKQVKSKLVEIKPDRKSTARITARIGGLTRSVNSLESRIARAETTLDAQQLIKQARIVAKRIGTLQSDVAALSRQTEHRGRLLAEDDEVLMIIVEME